ncbi:putative pectin lyase precursor [Aureobasidium pullulans]|uniref:pectin lyase n=1 Tax=Aureobasidium pullulans TaxID=5580 RepID=A0A4S8TIM6_AURPU|nr:putative pectin lyase precursor [Aureobasidium pullulans]THZ28146.1 putative pectin lyase precursor [Aureobasidium pullulans]TIA34054.1 putative pectin lyase precursor [Aureobasidium pullulans]
MELQHTVPPLHIHLFCFFNSSNIPLFDNMKLATSLIGAFVALAQVVTSEAVVGKADGFAYGVIGGGNASPDYPADIEELKSMLTDATPRVIVLKKTYDFTQSEGTIVGNVCLSWGDGHSCQQIIQDDCGDTPSMTAKWWKAPTQPIDVASHKTILGVGNKGVIRGKGLRFRGGASNIIVQNIQVSDLNNKYVWGGDAIGFDGADLIWIDHVTTHNPGRQHYVFGFNPSTRVTLSNNYINGNSTYSTSCDNYHYWNFEMVGTDDQITMKNNYMYRTAGRAPALSGGTLLHAVNNVWSDNGGHLLEGGDSKARGIFEGNVFTDINSMVADYAGRLFGTPAGSESKCKSALGRSCQTNSYKQSSGSLDSYTDTSFFGDFSGLHIASAGSAAQAASSVPQNAGAGIINVGA